MNDVLVAAELAALAGGLAALNVPGPLQLIDGGMALEILCLFDRSGNFRAMERGRRRKNVCSALFLQASITRFCQSGSLWPVQQVLGDGRRLHWA